VISGTQLFGRSSRISLAVSVSRHFGLTMKSCRNLTWSLFYTNLLKSTKGLKTANMIQDPTVNQHQHMVFIIISKQIKLISTFCNEIQILHSRSLHYNLYLIAIMAPQKGVGITPASVTFRLPIIISINKCNQLFMYRNVVIEMSPHRPKCLMTETAWPNRPDWKVLFRWYPSLHLPLFWLN